MTLAGGDIDPISGVQDTPAPAGLDRHRSVDDDAHLEVLVGVGFVGVARVIVPLGHDQALGLEGGDERGAIDLGHGLVR